MLSPTSPSCDAHSLARAAEALPCLPLSCDFYLAAIEAPLSSEDVSGNSSWCRSQLSIDAIEKTFIWLIRLGVLRREVDGQGLTARVRLTPMGRQLLQQWPKGLPKPGLLQRLRHGLRRRWPRL